MKFNITLAFLLITMFVVHFVAADDDGGGEFWGSFEMV
jgi:hypothetical protein